MKLITCLRLLVLIFLFAACKKPKPVIISGQLLLTKKNPVALSLRKIEIYQPGSYSAIGFSSGSSSSSAISVTDANGYFRVNFIPGTSTFIALTGTNGNSIILSSTPGDTAFPYFYRKNFPDSGYDETKPIFIGKSIDTAIIKVSLVTDLTITDTIGVQGYTVSGRLNKEYTGLTAPAGSVITLDTITNMLFTDFDCSVNKFINTLYAGRKSTTPWGFVTIFSHGFNSPFQLSATDETKQELLFYFNK
jgi:hypothetical protein